MKKPNPLISIVTCTWNSEKYLMDSMRSVISQKYANIQYIFVDGGSTDSTLDMIESLEFPKIVLHNISGGISKAMNAGVSVATGDVIAHLHSDDFYLTDDVLNEVADIFGDLQIGWAYGRIKNLVLNELRDETYVAPKYSRSRLLRGNFVPHPATFVRRNWLTRAGGFKEDLKYAMDYDLWLTLSKFGDPVEIGRPIAAFRIHEGSLSSSNRIKALNEDFAVRLSHCENYVERIGHYIRYVVRKKRAFRAAIKPMG
ncbi:MAG TPA: glycosyltransferase family 2 protein [Pseudobdellovibrionaceae bacterium]|nr:glycosyltransferase family 2 protein [Pseudobdellovibrionaceae bacterium]